MDNNDTSVMEAVRRADGDIEKTTAEPVGCGGDQRFAGWTRTRRRRWPICETKSGVIRRRQHVADVLTAWR